MAREPGHLHLLLTFLDPLLSRAPLVGYTALYTAYVARLRCCIPEYKIDLKHLIDLLIQDKRDNSSNYSLVILSEGAEWQGYAVKEYGEPIRSAIAKK
jgi:hypothetical protein